MLDAGNADPPPAALDYAAPAAAKPAKESVPLGGGAAAALYAVAATAVGLAIQIRDGEYTPWAVRLILTALGAGGARRLAATARSPADPSTGHSLLIVLLALLLLFQFGQLVSHRPDSGNHSFLPAAGLQALTQYKTLLLVAGVLTFVGVLSATGLFGRSLSRVRGSRAS